MVHGISLEKVHGHAKRRERRVPIGEIFARVQVQPRENCLPILQGGANLGVLFLPSRNVRRRSRGGLRGNSQRGFRFQIQTIEPARGEHRGNFSPGGKSMSGKLAGRVIPKVAAGKSIAVHGEEVARRHHGNIHFVILSGVEEQPRAREGKMIEAQDQTVVVVAKP